jgi:hypothetical protein
MEEAMKKIKRHVKKAKSKGYSYFFFFLNDGPSQAAIVQAIERFANSNGFCLCNIMCDKECFVLVLNNYARFIRPAFITLALAALVGVVLIALMLFLN